MILNTRLLTVGAALALTSTSLLAQSYSYSPPSASPAIEAPGYAYYFGRYKDMRSQQVDGNFNANAMTISETNFRPDARTHTVSTGMGRTWSSVMLHIGEADLNSLTTTFSTNFSSPPSLVFSGSVTWPTLNGPIPGPASFGYPFPFSSKFAKSAGKDFCCEYEFSGGVMANGGTSTGYSYYLDAELMSSYSSGTVNIYGNYSSTGGCTDSKSTVTYGAYNYIYMYNYGPKYSTTSYQNTMRSYVYGYYVPPSTSIMTVLGPKIDPKGSVFPGVTCQSVWVDLTLPVMLLATTSSSSTSTYTNFYNYFLGSSSATVPANPSWVGLQVAAQSAWTDSGNGTLKLTAGCLNEMPALPSYANFGEAKRAVIWSSSITATTGSIYQATSTSYYYSPICRYTN